MGSDAQIQRMMANPNSRLRTRRDIVGGCRCPHCGSSASLTIDSRPNALGVRRRRRCADCRRRWTTIEISLHSLPDGVDIPTIADIVDKARQSFAEVEKALVALKQIAALREVT